MNPFSIIRNDKLTVSNSRNVAFAGAYTQLRLEEERLYSDEQVASLPFIDIGHPHHKEWMIRKRSAANLLGHIEAGIKKPSILEVGCGNGWLSAQLATIAGSQVTGIDINSIEVQQAMRVFASVPNISFYEAELGTEIFEEIRFDYIIFAATIQYFPNLEKVITLALSHLVNNGEIIITDSVFYKKKALASAKQRTAAYFNSINMEPMAGYYFHHALEDFEPFHYRVVSEPDSWKNKLALIRNPFHRIIIKHPYR